MNKAQKSDLQSTIRVLADCLFAGTDGAVLDAGVGRSWVGYQITTALNTTTGTMTFNVAPSATEMPDEAQPTLAQAKNVNGTGASSSAYTEKPEDNPGYFPLDPVVFNGVRWLQPIHADSQTGKTIYFVSKPV